MKKKLGKNKKLAILQAIILSATILTSCKQPTIDTPIIEENKEKEKIIKELNRLQSIVYQDGKITNNTTLTDLENFINYINANVNNVDVSTYNDNYIKVQKEFLNALNKLETTEKNMPTNSSKYTENSWNLYQEKLNTLSDLGENPSYIEIVNRNNSLTTIITLLVLNDNTNPDPENPNPEEPENPNPEEPEEPKPIEPTILIGGIAVNEDNTINITNISEDSFKVEVKEENTIKELTINITPENKQTIQVKKLYDMYQSLKSKEINSTIKANDNITYTINGGNNRENNDVEGKILDNDLTDMKSFSIKDKLDIYAELEPLDNNYISHRTLTAKNGAKVILTGNYLDIGENTFKEDGGDFVLGNSDIILTNYNNYYGKDEYDNGSVDLYPNDGSVYKPISVDKVIDQFTILGLNEEKENAPKFNITLKDNSNIFKLATNLLNKYKYFSDNDGTTSGINLNNNDNFLNIGINYTFDNYTEGVPMFNGDEENPDHPSFKEENKINLRVAKFVGHIPSNAVLKINDYDTDIYDISSTNIVNLVVEGDASDILLSRGITSGFIKTKGQAFKDMPALEDSIYIYTSFPKYNTGLVGGFGGANDYTTLDFRNVEYPTDPSTVGKIITRTDFPNLYISPGHTKEEVLNLIMDGEGGFDNTYDGTNGYPRSIQDFEEQGNAYLKEKGVINTSSSQISKINDRKKEMIDFVNPDNGEILYSVLKSREYNG